MQERRWDTYLGLRIVDTSGNSLVLEEVQPAGKKRTPGKSFLADARNWVE